MNPNNKMRPIHPGEVLREEFLAELGLTPHALALDLKVPPPRINDIVRERRSITPDTALRLARYFGTTAQFWMNLQTSYDLKIAETENGAIIEREVQARAKSVIDEPELEEDNLLKSARRQHRRLVEGEW